MSSADQSRNQARALARRALEAGLAERVALARALADYDRALAAPQPPSFVSFLVERGVLRAEDARRLAPAPSRPLASTARDSRDPPVIPGLTILGTLGEGGMGVVYDAVDGQGRGVAVKLIRKADASPRLTARFERETEILKRLEHPHIVRFYGAGECEAGPWIAMERLRGEPLDELFESGRASLSQVCALVAQAAEAVHAAHIEGIIHRDLKPANIFVTEDMEARVMDFGLARDLDRETRLTRDNAVLGTAYYLSPEQARGRNDLVGPRSDVFALGVILYEGLTGRRPFEADTAAALQHKIVSTEPEPPHSVAEDIPASLSRVCVRALEKDLERRYPTARALARDLKAILEGERASVEAPAARLREALRARPWLTALAAAIFVLGALGLLGWPLVEGWQRSRAAAAEGVKVEAALLAVAKELDAALDARPEALPLLLGRVDEVAADIEALAGEDAGEAARLRALLADPRLRGRIREAQLRVAERALSAGLSEEALRAAEAALALAGEGESGTDARVLAGRARLALSDPAAALEVLPEGLEGEAALLRAQALERLGRPRDALKALPEAASASPAVRARRARLLAVTGQVEASDALFDGVFAAEPHPGFAIVLERVLALKARGAVEDALAELARHRWDETEVGPASVARSGLLRELGALDEARAELQAQLARDPADAAARMELVDNAFARGDLDEARAVLDGFPKSARRPPERRFIAAVLLTLLSPNRGDLPKVSGEGPAGPQVAYWLARLEPDRQAKATRLEALIASRAAPSWVWPHLAWLRVQEGAPTRARELLAAAPEPKGRDDELRRVIVRLALARVAQDPDSVLRLGTELNALQRQRLSEPRDALARAHRLLSLAVDEDSDAARGYALRGQALLRVAYMESFGDAEVLWRCSREMPELSVERARGLAREAIEANPHSLPAALHAIGHPRGLGAEESRLRAVAAAQAFQAAPEGPRRLELLRATVAELCKQGELELARSVLLKLEAASGRAELELRLAFAAANKDAEQFRLTRDAIAQRKDLLLKVIPKIEALLREDETPGKLVTSASVEQARRLFDQVEPLIPSRDLRRDLEAHISYAEANGFVASLYETTEALRRPRQVLTYTKSLFLNKGFLLGQGIRRYLEGPAREHGMTESEEAFCRASYLFVDTMQDPGRNLASKQSVAREILEAAERCLGDLSPGPGAWLMRAYAHGLLGRPHQAEADLARLTRKEDIAGVEFIALALALQRGERDVAADHAEAIVATGYNPRAVATHPVLRSLRDHPRIQRLAQ